MLDFVKIIKPYFTNINGDRFKKIDLPVKEAIMLNNYFKYKTKDTLFDDLPENIYNSRSHNTIPVDQHKARLIQVFLEIY